MAKLIKIRNEDSDYYGYNDTNTDKASIDINDVVFRKKKPKRPQLTRKRSTRK